MDLLLESHQSAVDRPLHHYEFIHKSNCVDKIILTLTLSLSYTGSPTKGTRFYVQSLALAAVESLLQCKSGCTNAPPWTHWFVVLQCHNPPQCLLGLGDLLTELMCTSKCQPSFSIVPTRSQPSQSASQYVSSVTSSQSVERCGTWVPVECARLGNSC